MAFASTSSFDALASLDPKVRFTLPPVSYLKFPPSDLPAILPPPSDHPALSHPFTIPTNIYNALLSPYVPVTIALVYATTIKYLNTVNERRNNKPWAFSKTRFFKLLVVTHNIILAVYSAWTFVGMTNGLRESIYNPRGAFGWAGTVDSLCKINGPRGVGSAARYNATTSAWGIANRAFHLGVDGLAPESTDVGRMWNEGLAFYGWLFYLSKFYEVVDTLIIVAKGKQSSLLQTYHHAGAMLCMWAGIRYMSGPIWMFVFVNSFIHAIMYTFYLFTAVGVRVPVPLKRALTTMQITQFVIGASYAFLHLFVKYQTPISVPYLYHLGSVSSAVVSDASSTASSVFTSATASANIASVMKKVLLRAAGAEGLAENVLNEQGQTFGIDAVHAAKDFVKREELRYRNELEWTHCLDTSGQTFAVLLNFAYLLPLTVLFVQFFIRSYLRRLERRRSSTPSHRAAIASQSGRDAIHSVSRRLSEAFDPKMKGIDGSDDDVAVIDDEEFKEEVRTVKEEVKAFASKTKKQVQSTATETKKQAKAAADKKEGIQSTLADLKDKADPLKAKAGQEIEAGIDQAKEMFESVKAAVVPGDNSGNEVDEQRKTNGFDEEEESADKSIDDTNEAREESSDSNLKDTTVSNFLQQISDLKAKFVDDKPKESPTDDQNEEHPQFLPREATDLSRMDDDEDIQEDDHVSTSKDFEDAKQAERRKSGLFSPEQETEKGPEEEVAGKALEESAEPEHPQEILSPKEQVRPLNSKKKENAEASTGDAGEDESPATKQPGKNVATTKSSKENNPLKNPSVEGRNAEDVTNKEDKSEEPGVTERIGQAMKPVAEKVRSTADKATSNGTASSDPSKKAKKGSDTGDNSAVGKQEEVTSDNLRQPDKEDFDDQKESWIHIKDEPEEVASSKPTTTQDTAPASSSDTKRDSILSDEMEAESDELTSSKSADKSSEKPAEKNLDARKQDNQQDQPTYATIVADDSRSDTAKGDEQEHDSAPETVTNKEVSDDHDEVEATSNTTKAEDGDKTQSAKANKDEKHTGGTATDEVADDQNGVRSEADKTTKAAKGKRSETEPANTTDTALDKIEQDKIIDESEPLRDDSKSTTTDTAGKKDTSESVCSSQNEVNTDTDTKTAGPSKQEQDKIIDESEPLRDDVVDDEVAAPATPPSKGAEAGRMSPRPNSYASSPRWHSKRKG